MTHSDKISDEWTLPPVDGLEVVGHVKPEHPEAVEPVFVRELSQPWMKGIFTVPVVTLSQASSVIAGLREANEALMRERSSLIETKREQIERLTKERSSLEEENKRLREALKPFAEAGDNTDANDDYSSASIWEHPCAMDITIGDLRRARRICPQTEDHNG